MSDTNGSTTGVWIPEDSDILERFDATFEGSRSRQILNAMELQITIAETLEQAGYGDLQGRDVEAFVRQAILEQARREDATE